ncbi:MAG: sigma-54-dependent Fis family transcriptional regulator [Deltaproteobacteria bacterium]|nr:sigma-54-dependent Fis family transcriptional regulator [Deltaproteobacteria bacterium]
MARHRILFIEDDTSGREVGVFNLEKAGFDVDTAASGEEGLELFDSEKHTLVITDVRMPGISGMEVLSEVKKRAPHVPVLVITAYANVDLAVDAMKAGAFDFIGKPFNRDLLIITVNKALERRQLSKEVQTLRIRASGVERPIIYRSKVMRQVIDIADRVASSDATVLVTGESGTGKELVARRIHVLSDHAHGPFIPVNVAAMPAELLESELFGHEKGAFTGASRSRTGRFRQADGGTLFLDEIAELPLSLQGKLLRVLQERVVDVVGADTPMEINARIVTATNRDLLEEVRASRFREDLYYRINVVELKMPPLKDRPEDIELLARHFIDQYANGQELAVPDSLIERLREMQWPGNIRELQNTCQRLVLLCRDFELSVDDLPDRGIGKYEREASVKDILDEWPTLPDEGLPLVDLERKIIERVLQMKGGNVSQTAAYLNIPRHVLAYRMEKYGISRKGK